MLTPCIVQAIGDDALLAGENLSWNVWLFFGAQLLHGAGASPLFTLGVTYIDENVSKRMSSVYLGKCFGHKPSSAIVRACVNKLCRLLAPVMRVFGGKHITNRLTHLSHIHPHEHRIKHQFTHACFSGVAIRIPNSRSVLYQADGHKCGSLLPANKSYLYVKQMGAATPERVRVCVCEWN